jgi:sugar phosphate isomerase/epimerase
LLDILQYLNHHEIIIHPFCRDAQNDNGVDRLCDRIAYTLGYFAPNDITVYLENNSRLDPRFQTVEEVELVLRRNPRLEFLLDVAHIDSYEHLQALVNVKMPKALHIADRHLEVVHEHLPIGQGNIDYESIFKTVLHDFQGKIILEIIQSSEDILNSKRLVEKYLGIS